MLVGIDVENIVHTFVLTGDTSRIDWATVFKSAGYSDSRVRFESVRSSDQCWICFSPVVSMTTRGKLGAVC